MDNDAYFMVVIGILSVVNTFLVFYVWYHYTNTSKRVLRWMKNQELRDVSLASHIMRCENCIITRTDT